MATMDDFRIKLAFIIFGTVVYTMWSVILVAAQDILSGSSLPTTTVLLAQIGPNFVVTSLFPFFIQKCSYWVKILFLCPTFIGGILLVGLPSQVKWKLVGVAVSALASGAAESTFVPLTAMYSEATVSAYFTGSGIGVVAAPLYYSGMTILGCVSPSSTILYLIAAVALLPLSYQMLITSNRHQNSQISNGHQFEIAFTTLSSDDEEEEEEEEEEDVEEVQLTFKDKFLLIFENLFVFLMLFIGMFCEYLTLQSVITTVAFPDAPFRPKDHYVIYSFVILVGELIGRSYGLILSSIKPNINPYTKHTWLLAGILTVELLFLVLESWYRFLANVWIFLVLLVPVGVGVGALYVNSIAVTGEHEKSRARLEFSRAFVLAATPSGILAASLLGLFVEPFLRRHCEIVTIETRYCFTRSVGTRYANMTCFGSRFG